MKTIKYIGAYLSGNTGDENRKWVLVLKERGCEVHRLFGDLKFWAQRQCVEQGFSK